MYRMDKNTAERPAVTPAAKMWRSRVNAIIWHVRLRFGNLRLAVSLAWPIRNDSLRRCSLPRRKKSTDATG